MLASLTAGTVVGTSDARRHLIFFADAAEGKNRVGGTGGTGGESGVSGAAGGSGGAALFAMGRGTPGIAPGIYGLGLSSGGGILDASLLFSRSSLVPGATPQQHFEAFGGPVGDDGDSVVAFIGAGGQGSLGIYAFAVTDTGPGGKTNATLLAKVVDTATPVPGGGGATFTAFPFAPSVSKRTVVFFASVRGGGAGANLSGIYSWHQPDGTLRPVATLGDTGLVYMAARAGGFDGVNGCAAFYGSTRTQDALYLVGVQ
jgi:hypothetical protein